MSEADKEKDVSCFTVDGVVAEMVIEVEDNQKSGLDDFKDTSSSLEKDKDASDDKKDEDLDIDKSNDVEEKQNENIQSEDLVEAEKKEDKENLIEISENNDNQLHKEEKGSDKKNNQNLKSNQNLKKKRKNELTVNYSENKNTEIETSRYPGVKRRKLETDSKEVDEIKIVPNEKHLRKSIRNKESNPCANQESGTPKESNKADSSKSISKNETGEIKEPKTKQDVLRKLPFRKNRDAPDVPDLKPKVYWWNGVGEGEGIKLGDISEIRQRIRSGKSIRALYRVMFFQWPSNGKDLVGEILDFNGFPFDKSSYEFTKRQSLMKIMLDATISNMCEILDVRKGEKSTMIDNILDFLLRPYAKIDPSQDPSLQPVVLLERIDLDKFFDETSGDVQSKKSAVTRRSLNLSKKNKENVTGSASVTPARTTRGSALKGEIVESSTSKKATTKAKEDSKFNKSKTSTPKESDVSPTTKDSKVKGLKDVRGKTSGMKDTKTKSTVKYAKAKVILEVKESKPSFKEEKLKTEEKSTVKNAASKRGRKRKKWKMNKKNIVTKKKTMEKKSPENESKENSDDFEMIADSGPENVDEDIEMEDDEPKQPVSLSKEKDKKKLPEKQQKKVTVSSLTLSDSSETESAEETKLVTATRKTSKTPMRRKGKPLKHFPEINESIQKANFSALQRLHILLFGASDKAENLKGNILAFGGFPFLEGSDEWKQKHFLLSLLAQNNLREYLNLLCIEYSGDDQPTMINKLMRFLAVPSEDTLQNKRPIETEVVSSELVTISSPPKSKSEGKKKAKKKEEKKSTGPKHRKILMSEEEARRLEASFAREQRALARENKTTSVIMDFPTIPTNPIQNVPINPQKLHPQSYLPTKPLKPPTADPNQLNALLQTVFKRRALKAAGAVISTPNKGERTKLGDIENIKFLIVTSNLTDLEMLHRVIFMMEASKSRIRKNILDFEGFGFNEDSPKYKERMDFLKRLGYDASKRISFLLGLCPLQTDIPQQDLNELIMYFLMFPCKNKQVFPITEMPPSDEPHIIVKSTAPVDKPLFYQNVLETSQISTSVPQTPKSSVERSFETSTPIAKTGSQKARKSFPSSIKFPPVKQVLLPPAQSPILGIAPAGNKPQKVTLLNSIPGVPAFSISKTPVQNMASNVTLINTSSGIAVLNTPNSSVNSLVKLPAASHNSKVPIVNQGSKVTVLDAGTKVPMNTIPNISGQVLQNPVIFPQMSNKVGAQPQTPLVPGSKMVIKTPTGSTSTPQEFLVQQQTPDGHQKTFKLIRLPPNHPLASAVGKPPAPQTVASSQIPQQVILTNAPLTSTTLPPGLIIMKNTSGLPPAVQNVQTILQNAPVKVSTPIDKISTPAVSTSQSMTVSNTEEIVLSDERESADTSGNSVNDPDLEGSNSLEDSPPTDEDLLSCIQEILLVNNFEDITLRNVIERVAAQFPNHDLTHRHQYMKDCVKNIIVGT